MKRIKLDASDWSSRDDFYDALLPALGAPDWHGRNLDALLDSLSAGDINAVKPPFVVELRNTSTLNDELRAFLGRVVETFGYAKDDRDSDVELVVAA